MIKTLEALISVKYVHRGDKIFQHFIIEKKKGVSKYILDTRFLIYDKFQEKIKEFSLSNKYPDNLIFIERRDEEDRIVLEFKELDKIRLKNYYFVVPGFVPPSAGCEYCRFRKDNEDEISFYCEFKKKGFAHRLKNCQFFRQQEGLLKT